MLLLAANENTASFVVMADVHSMSNFLLIDPENLWNSLTPILSNIKSNYSNTDIVMAPGDLTSFGRLQNKRIQEITGIEDENDAASL